MLAPRSEVGAAAVKFEEVRRVMDLRCVSCHAAKPSFPGLAEAPRGLALESAQRIRAMAPMIHQQTVQSRVMPPGNVTGMTDGERALLDRWYRGGAKAD
jgi:uncharacterized membrane protein